MATLSVRPKGSSTTNLQRFFNNLLEHQKKNEFCDFTLITNGSPIECHKVVLSAASPYFKNLLLDDADHKLLNIMDLSPTPLSVVNTAVAFIYNSDYNIEDDNVIELLKLSVKWQLDSLSKECSQYMSNNITIENAAICYSCTVNSAEFSDSTKFKYFLRQHFSELFQQGHLKELSLSSFCTLLADDNIDVETDDVIFSAAMEIINEQTSEADINKCVGLIQFQKMSLSFLLDVVQPHPVMLTQERCLLVKEALRCQLTKPPSPSISQGSRRADLDIHYIINDHIYRYMQDTYDVTARMIKKLPRVIDSDASVSFHSNRLAIASGHEVTLINLTGSLNIEHLPRLSYRGEYKSRVLATEDSLYVLNCPIDLRPTGYYDFGDLWGSEPSGTTHGRRSKNRNRNSRRANSGTSSNISVFHLSLSNKVWNSLQPMPSAVESPLIVSYRQYIYVIGSINRSDHFSAVYRYCTINKTWHHCKNLPASVSTYNADVVVHDGVIRVFLSTMGFKYIEDSDTWSTDSFHLAGQLVKVLVKGQNLLCVTRETRMEAMTLLGVYGYNDHVRKTIDAQFCSPNMDQQSVRFDLQTYDVNTNQWIEKHKMEFGYEEPYFFF